MKKTLTINLNSAVFNIDEDAYNKLQDYLSELRHHLEKEERDEVIQDIEARIGELFSQRLTHYKNVITIEDVENVISTLGTPDSFGPRTTEDEMPKKKRRHRLYRDPDSKIIAGVASGISTSEDIDVTLVRIIFVAILCLSFGMGLFFYIILWLIIPEARTVAQKLEMRGIEPTLQNISDYSSQFSQSAQPTNNSTTKTLFKIIGFLILMPIVLVLASIVVAIFFAMIFFFVEGLPEMFGVPGFTELINGNGGISLIIMTILGIASAVIPIVLIIKLIIHAIRRTTNEINTRRFFITLIIWIVIVITITIMAITYYRDHKQDLHNISQLLENYDATGELITEVRCDSLPFNSIDASKVELILIPDTINRVEVTSPSSLMRNVQISVKDSLLTIDCTSKFNASLATVKVHYVKGLKKIDISAGAELSGEVIAATIIDIKISAGSEAEITQLNCEGVLSLEAQSGSECVIKHMEATTLNVSASSGSDITLCGIAENVTASASSGAEIDILQVKSKNIRTNTSSGGEIEYRQQTH